MKQIRIDGFILAPSPEPLYKDEVLEDERDYVPPEEDMELGDEASSLCLRDDIAFHFAMDDDRDAFACLLSTVTGRGIKSGDILAIEVQKSLQPIPPAHRVVYDAFVSTVDDDFIIEIQLKRRNDFWERVRYYIAISDATDLVKGSPYRKLRKKTIIFYCGYDFAKEGRPLYTYKVMRDDGQDVVDYGMRIIVNGTYKGKGIIAILNGDMKQRAGGVFHFPALGKAMDRISNGYKEVKMSEYLERYKRKVQKAGRAMYANQLAAIKAERQAEKT